MEKRKLEKLGIETSLLGFGCMRFPTTPDGKIDEAEAERMMDKAIASGVNYIDTAYPYHNGESEPLVGKVLKKYDRSSFYLATKLPLWAVKSVDDAKRIFEEQLQRLQTDYIDFYLLHAVNKEKWEEMKALGVVDYCAKLKEEGRSVTMAFPSMMIMKYLMKSSVTVTGISARFSIIIWIRRSRPGIRAMRWLKAWEYRLLSWSPLRAEALLISPMISMPNSVKWIRTRALHPMLCAGWEAIPM